MKQSLPGWKATRLLSPAGIALCFAVTTLQLPAQARTPLQATVKLAASKQPLSNLLATLADSAHVKFAYDEHEIQKYAISLSGKKEWTVEEVLKKVLRETNLTYEKHANTIVIFPKEKTMDSISGGNSSPMRFSLSAAQNDPITGKVMDASGPLANATVQVKGSTTGTQTDASGTFSLSASTQEVKVIVSLIGYEPKEYTLTAGKTNVIYLTPANKQLDSIVVVGYGTQKRSAISGAVADVKLDHLTSRSVGSVAEALQGKAPGVVVQNEGGDPTSLPRVNIRGVGGLNGDNPLYVIDGSIFSGTPVLNPNEIESISVLKDASAAIYGANASGGVILITTKKGKKGTATVTLDAKYGTQSPWRKLYSLNAKEMATVENLAADNAGVARRSAFDSSVFPDGQITRTNWIDDVFRTGHLQEYNIGVSGGNDKSTYFMGLGYRKNEGILLNTFTERFTVRLNSAHQLRSWLKVGENMSWSRNSGKGASTQDAYTGAILSALYYPSNVAPYNADGTFAGLPAAYAGDYGDVINPVAYLMRLDNNAPVSNLVFNPYVEIKLLPSLTYRSNFSFTQENTFGKEFDARVLEIGKKFDFNKLTYNISDGQHLLAEQTLNFNQSFNKHNLSALAGYSYKTDNNNYVQVYTQNFVDEDPARRYLQNGADLYTPSSGRDRSALISWIGRINYDYNNRYLLTVLGRRDGSSLVGKDKFHNYYSVSGGWVASKENFLKSVDWLTNLKLRASYGIIGNLGSIPVTAVSPLLKQTQTYGGLTPTLSTGLAATVLPNPDLTWANSKQTNFGIDLSLWKNRISFVADYFIKDIEKMVVNLTPPGTTGVSGKWVNGGKSRDKGIELGINYNNDVHNPFQYSINATVTSTTNKLISLPDGLTTLATQDIVNVRSTLTPLAIRVGEPLYSYYVIRTAGIFQSQADIDNYKSKNGVILQPKAKPGDMKFVNANGDDVIDNKDRVIAGSAYPRFSYSFSFNASYKNFDLNILAQGVQGNKLFNALKYTSMNAAIGTNYNMLKDILNAWSPTNTGSGIPRISASDANGNFGNTSDFYIENGSYLRIKNVTLGYTIPQHLTDKLQMSGIRVYLTANNLFTFTHYKGFDPEVGMDKYGVDMARYPQSRAFIAGINVTF